MTPEVVNLAQKLARFSEHWSPRVVAEMNDYQIKLVKLQGEFVWHEHKDTDEVFCRKASSTSPAPRASATP